jgi:hypothetical protein
MLSQRLLVRAAVHLQALYQAKAAGAGGQEQVLLQAFTHRQQSLTHTIRRLDQARRRGLHLVVPSLHETLHAQMKTLQDTADVVRGQMEKASPQAPDLRTLVAELRQLEAEFESLEIDLKNKCLTALTEPIELQDVYLGAFAIRFDWQRLRHLSGVSCFAVVARDPHPVAGDASITHPHVKDESLCAGDAAVPLQHAVNQGRLADAFCLIRSVLRYYNPSSAFAQLDGWNGKQCQDCGCTLADDDACFCSVCGHYFCDDCTRWCKGCDTARCLECLTRCVVCENVFCGRCLPESVPAGKACCAHCRRTCPGCQAQVSKLELLPDTGLCPTCHKSRTLPATAGLSVPS